MENDAKRIEELRRWEKTEQEREEARRGLSVITTIYEYSLDGKNIAFAGYDKRIDVFKNDESAILVSLQLAHN